MEILPVTSESMNLELLCTLGPSSMNERIIRRLTELDVTLFRINLSHTAGQDVADVIDAIARHTDVPICLDTEGAQIRTGKFVDGSVTVHENRLLNVHRRRVPGDALNINLYPTHIIDDLVVGDFISIDFNSVLAQVIETGPETVTLRVINGGRIGSNKAVTLQRPIDMAPLTEKDIAAIAIGREKGIRHFALSFANRRSDVEQIRDLTGPGAFIISKIECRNGLTNLDAITEASDAILIDRGDLSREIPISRIPAAQKMIIGRGKAIGRKVYVATNLLESMIEAPLPTRAEVNDIYNTLADGADGLVLAAETAIGKFPIESAQMVRQVAGEFAKSLDGSALQPFADPVSQLAPPHGGELVQLMTSETEAGEAVTLPQVRLDDNALSDIEQIALGTYSPLRGFMGPEELDAVLDDCRLPDGTAWTMPIMLHAPADLSVAEGRMLVTAPDGAAHSILDVRRIYEADFAATAQRWYGTTDSRHPGVALLQKHGCRFVEAGVKLIRRRAGGFSRYDLTPAQLRFIFAHKGWGRVVGFHSRNAPHRAHEHIQLAAIERCHADGLLISPVIGAGKQGDFLPNIILDSYQAMLDFGIYPAGRVVLSSFQTWPRYAGPREAVFTALCRKNMGCSHFVIGRDHTGVGGFYAADENVRIFERLGDIGIEPVFFDAVGYNHATGRHETMAHDGVEAISGTFVRDTLVAGRELPEWMMRREVQECIAAELRAGRPVFQE